MSSDVVAGAWVYRSSRRDQTYVFLAERDGFEVLPDALRKALGRLEFVMDLELHPGRRLARNNVATVLADLRRQGFHLQLPPVDNPVEGVIQ